MSKFLILLLGSIIAAVVNAGCDNSCSGHGTCGDNGVCVCFDNWGMGLSHDSGDCSERICPYEFAWVDAPNKMGRRHKYAECAARGICDRSSGECACFPGYEGKACQRSACPNDCSGHGKCAFIEDQGESTSRMDTMDAQGYEYEDDPITKLYNGWDELKSRACICDAAYGEIDCSKRLCEHATDVMDNRPNMLVAAKYHTQKLTLMGSGSTGALNQWQNKDNTFALKFISKLNETFITSPINLVENAADCHNFTLHVQRALVSLPNNVIDDVKVAAACGIKGGAGGQFITTYQNTNKWFTTLNITFTGNNVQGAQNALQAIISHCGAGCSPRLDGLELAPRTMNVSEVIASDFNSIECGNRGKCDYTTGVCSCFEGYTGLACNTITSLV